MKKDKEKLLTRTASNKVSQVRSQLVNWASIAAVLQSSFTLGNSIPSLLFPTKICSKSVVIVNEERSLLSKFATAMSAK